MFNFACFLFIAPKICLLLATWLLRKHFSLQIDFLFPLNTLQQSSLFKAPPQILLCCSCPWRCKGIDWNVVMSPISFSPGRGNLSLQAHCSQSGMLLLPGLKRCRKWFRFRPWVMKTRISSQRNHICIQACLIQGRKITLLWVFLISWNIKKVIVFSL